MQDLEEAGTPDLDAVRSRLFSFEDILLLTQKARVALFDGLSTELVTLACIRRRRRWSRPCCRRSARVRGA